MAAGGLIPSPSDSSFQRMKRVLLIAACAVAGSCAGIRHATDFDPAHGFRGYETYEWALDAHGLEVPEAHHPIREQVDGILRERGYRKVSANADFLIHPHLGPTGMNFREAYGLLDYAPSRNLPVNLDGRDYPADALVLDVIDRRSSLLVWRGSATRVFDAETGRPVRLPPGVEVILRDFPPF